MTVMTEGRRYASENGPYGLAVSLKGHDKGNIYVIMVSDTKKGDYENV